MVSAVSWPGVTMTSSEMPRKAAKFSTTSRIVACPDSLKGVLASGEAAAALAEGCARAGVACDEVPLADGGEGTAEVLFRAFGGEWRSARVHDPLGREIESRFLLLPDGSAVVESAEPLGLSRLAAGELDPLRASSLGLGELILAAGDRDLILPIGGTATVDGGAGLREVVEELPARATVLCDVRSPLLDAARVFAAQKGASPADAVELERRLAEMEELQPYADVPGAGAAGGLGAAFAALGAELVAGAEYVIEAVGLRERVRGAALVITGEGQVDRTSAEGKVAGAVVRLCAEEGVRCAVFGGRVEEPLPGAESYELSGDPERAPDDLAALGERLARSIL
jgi:glycerate 2-kinase